MGNNLNKKKKKERKGEKIEKIYNKNQRLTKVQKIRNVRKSQKSTIHDSILLVLPFDEISLQQELSSPHRFRIQGRWSEPDGQTKDERKSLCLILDSYKEGIICKLLYIFVFT